MSAGRFVFLGYISNDNGDFRVRVQPETETLQIGGVTNSSLAGPLPGDLRQALVSVGKRRRGTLITRAVGIKFNEGGAPAGYAENSIYYLPWFNNLTFGNFGLGAPVAYLGGTGTFVGRSPERDNL